ncbi:hypothetical protein EHP00_505 [Ecytonucleospora hepatopenaei]|uniref:Uncharacterized protein n=1 Tax=Ecytonucleospora hepatopenaei TaxID=646526 RepID=A0A1W0E456_9MICR|nr:hypothetical protein EHP00_505 [Ecytonucleospora hepatopenaei]
MFYDFYIHHFISHALESLIILPEFDHLFKAFFNIVEIVFSIDFTLYEKFMGMGDYFQMLNCKLGVLNSFKIFTNKPNKEELDEIYSNWVDYFIEKNDHPSSFSNQYFYDTAFIKRLKINKKQLLEYQCKIKKLFNEQNAETIKNQTPIDCNLHVNEKHKHKKMKVK